MYKQLNKNGRLTSKEAEQIQRNKLCVDLIITYAILGKGKNNI